MNKSQKDSTNKIKLTLGKFFFKSLLKLGVRNFVAKLGIDETKLADYFVKQFVNEDGIYEIEGFKLKKGRTTRLPILTGEIEPSQTDLMKKIVKPSMNVFDLGANFGWFTLVLSKLVGSSGQVYSFEADPYLVNILEENVKLNNFSNISIQPIAVSNKTGTSKFSLNEFYDTRSQLDSISHSKNTIDVKITSLDDFCLKENLKKVDLIKMDIEGSELKTLEGMRKIILDNPHLKIITEFNQTAMLSVGSSPECMIDFLLEAGFIIEEIDEKTPGKLKKISKEKLLEKKVCNCYCYKI